MKSKDTSMSGQVVVGMPGTVAGVVASPIIRMVGNNCPNILVRVTESTNQG